jgi:hypothetical protein
LSLVLTGEAVSINPDGLINPFESETLQDLVSDILRSPNDVEVVAFGGVPAVGFFVDAFFANPAFQRPRRSVYVADLEDIERMSATLARALMGHVLREYFGASRPPGQQPGNAFANYHVPAILTEAQIAGDLLNRPVWTGHTRPWEAMFGNINVRSYGPTMKFQLFFNGGRLQAVREP